jgi:hypothetical protein
MNEAAEWYFNLSINEKMPQDLGLAGYLTSDRSQV